MSKTYKIHGAVVIGAGPAGLAAAGALAQGGVAALVLDRAESLAASWRGHYDRLRLHTASWFSHLPGYRIPSGEGRYVTRDGVIRYLEAYAAQHRLEVRCGIEVTSIDRDRDHWPEALALSGDEGARVLLRRYGAREVPCDGTGDPIDVDTPEAETPAPKTKASARTAKSKR